MKTKLISLTASVLCILLCFFALASCDGTGIGAIGTTDAPTSTSTPDSSAPDSFSPEASAPDSFSPEASAPDSFSPEASAPDSSAPEASSPEASEPTAPSIDKNAWDIMISDKMFENYTLTMEGNMSLTQGGQDLGVSHIRETMLITADKVKIISYSEDMGSSEEDTLELLVEGKDAELQKVQCSQIFLNVLRNYESFVFDATTGAYIIPNEISFDITLIGITVESEGAMSSFEVPSTIDIREASAVISEDGKLLTFVCDYTQTMNVGGGQMSTSGKTTWIFSDYGTTVIE